MSTDPDKSQNLKFRPNRTFICSVVFIDIVEYSMKSVNEQIQGKERFNAILSEAIKDISVNDRIMLDTGDGVAIGFLGDPEDALFVAMSLRDSLREDQSEAAPELQVRMGINLGPVKFLKDINNQPNLIGDGINVAQRIMSFAEPGELLVSRSYYEIVSCLSQEYAKLFHYQGARADKHIREHDIYAVENTGLKPVSFPHTPEKKPEALMVKDTAATVSTKPLRKEPAGLKSETAAEPSKKAGNRKWLLMGGSIAAVIIGLLIFVARDKAPVDGTRAAVDDRAASASRSARTAKATQNPDASASSAKETATLERMSDGGGESENKTFKSVTVKADDILFTVTGMKSSGNDITFIIRTYNRSGVAKSVALYDDAYRWKKSQMTDGNGKRHDVSKVSFTKASKRIAMSAAGTEGIHINPRESVTAYMTFKRAGHGVKALSLHPFIYQGRRHWTEHNLNLPLGP